MQGAGCRVHDCKVVYAPGYVSLVPKICVAVSVAGFRVTEVPPRYTPPYFRVLHQTLLPKFTEVLLNLCELKKQ